MVSTVMHCAAANESSNLQTFPFACVKENGKRNNVMGEIKIICTFGTIEELFFPTF